MERGEPSKRGRGRGRGRGRKNPLKDIVASSSRHPSGSRQVEDNQHNQDDESPVQNQNHSSPCGEEWNNNNSNIALRSSMSPKSFSKLYIPEYGITTWGKRKRRISGADVSDNGTTGCAETRGREEGGGTHSFNITEVAGCSRDVGVVVNVNGYHVKQEVATLFEKIIEKHGDVGKDCDIKCGKSRGLFAEMMCSVYQKLKDTTLKEITDIEIEDMLAIVNILQNAKFDMKWLSERLKDISSFKSLSKEYDAVKNENEKKKEVILKKEEKIDDYTHKLLIEKAELMVLKVEFDTVNRETESLMEKGRVLSEKSLVYGLL